MRKTKSPRPKVKEPRLSEDRIGRKRRKSVRGRANGWMTERPTLSHIDASGRFQMVDVGGKSVTVREAIARGHIAIGQQALHKIRKGKVAKGDPLQAARLAGVMAAKRTADLIPLCHPLPLSYVNVELKARQDGYDIQACVRTSAQTGVEMEALSAVTVAALTVYDMVKAVDRTMVIGDISLVKKTGGSSGSYHR